MADAEVKTSRGRRRQHAYGVPVPRNDGRCSGCLGDRDKEVEGEAVLLCDGRGCSREYHLRCVDPPITEVPKGEFICIDCDPRGASAHLRTYFDSTEDVCADFQSSRDFVQSLLYRQMKDALAAEDAAGEAVKTKYETVETDDVRARKRPRKSSSAGGTDDDGIIEAAELSDWPLRERPPRSELTKMPEFYCTATREIDRSSSSSSSQSQEKLHHGKGDKIGPNFLVGKPIQLYCPLDNSYHHGRIVDWRRSSRAPLHDYYGGAGDIACSEFLVRFPPGLNGRKVELYQWIILEEHCVAISLAIIFAQFKKGRGLGGWKPAQLIVRSSLELITIRHLLIDGEDPYALAFFFGEATRAAYLRLRDECSDFFSPTFSAHLGDVHQIEGPSPSGSSQLDLSVYLALLEHEEQRRVLKWYNMPLQNPAHPKALTAADEHSLESVTLPPSHRICQDESAERKEHDADDDAAPDSSVPESSLQPKLCPLIEHGADRMWLAHLLRGESLEKSRDTMESIRIESVASVPSAMALLQQQRQA